MDFRFTQEEEAFRNRIRSWLRANLPEGWGPSSSEPTEDDARAAFRLQWERKLHQGGWNGLNWPAAFGGQGVTLTEQAIFLEECARANAPLGINHMGRNLVGPVLMAYGTDKQKQHFLPRILAAADVWCQGFSEPNAGSDLASLRTKAEIIGDEFVINGAKIWTSWAQYAQWCILLVRTDQNTAKHRGLSFILVDLATPGITIRPIKRATGHAEFCQVFYDDVRVSRDNLVGELNSGWQIAMSTLGFERGPEEALARQVRFQYQADMMLAMAQKVRRGGKPAIEDSSVRQKLASCLIEVELMRLNCLRGFSSILRKGELGPEASFTKLYWSHMSQRMAEVALEIEGAAAPLAAKDPDAIDDGAFQNEFMTSRGTTIYSGTSEIQRNIIAERVLGLPR